MEETAVEVWQIVRDEDGRDLVLLRDEQGRMLSITIGVCEAAAIWVAHARHHAKPFVRRPWTHDLLQSMLDRLHAKLDRVVIDGFAQGIFFATLHLVYHGQEVMIDARPSDAIALLLRTASPLFVSEDVMKEEGFLPGAQDDEEPGYGEGLV